MGWAPKTREEAGRKPRPSKRRKTPSWDDEDYEVSEVFESSLPTVLPLEEIGPEPRPHHLRALPDIHATIIQQVKSGKEATGFIAHSDGTPTGYAYFVKQLDPHRRQSNVADYVDIAEFGDARVARAVKSGSKFGRLAAQHHWAKREFATLCELWNTDAPVPYPIGRAGLQVSMELIASNHTVANRLADIRVKPEDADWILDGLHRCLRSLASVGVVHGDLSPYNILVVDQTLMMIDFPQAVRYDPNPKTSEILDRDIARIAEWAVRQRFSGPMIRSAIGQTRSYWC